MKDPNTWRCDSCNRRSYSECECDLPADWARIEVREYGKHGLRGATELDLCKKCLGQCAWLLGQCEAKTNEASDE